VNARRVILSAALLSLAVSVAVYPWLPTRMPVHFDLAGHANRFGSRAEGAFLLPAIGFVTYAIARATPDGAKGLALAVVSVFLAALHVLVLGAALGDGTLGDGTWIALGAFFAALGLVLPRIRPNRWIGVRTPWAMRSPDVWARTQRVGGATMFACGALVLLSASAHGARAAALRLVALVASAFVPIVYSWWVGRGAERS